MVERSRSFRSEVWMHRDNATARFDFDLESIAGTCGVWGVGRCQAFIRSKIVRNPSVVAFTPWFGFILRINDDGAGVILATAAVVGDNGGIDGYTNPTAIADPELIDIVCGLDISLSSRSWPSEEPKSKHSAWTTR